MRRALIALCLLLASGCDYNTVTHHYDTLAQAKADRLFERGWLPDVLPPSARNIRLATNIDVDTSTGSFEFDPAEAGRLFGQLTPGPAEPSRIRDWPDTKGRYAARGMTAWSYRKAAQTWTFFCSGRQGRCEFFLW